MIKNKTISNFKRLQTISKTDLVKLFEQTNSLQGVLNILGITRDPRCTVYINSILQEFGITKKLSVKEDIFARELEIIKIASTCVSILSILQELGICTIRKGMHPAVKQILNKHNIILPRRFLWTQELIFCLNSKFPKGHLSKQVIKYSWMEYKCALCDLLPIWNFKELKLQIDHINGINNDHRKENLRWLCPNCHSQTETFCKSNRK